ncbi:MAG: hypothetical protein ABIH92_00435 [Nanoarchaeota archaeon]
MKLIQHSSHLRLRLKIRKFPEHYPNEIYLKPEQSFFDIVEQRKIAIKRLKYKGRIRNIMIAYDESDNAVQIVTIHPISDEKIVNRTITGRWIKHG